MQHLICVLLIRFTTAQVVEVVKDLARSGITICSTIHSPTPRCFSLFDHVLILLRGHLVYDGTPGTSAADGGSDGMPRQTCRLPQGHKKRAASEPIFPEQLLLPVRPRQVQTVNMIAA